MGLLKNNSLHKNEYFNYISFTTSQRMWDPDLGPIMDPDFGP
jgi:hypothetical protein